MPNYSDLFAEINNAVLDLQNAQLQSYDRPLKTLARLLRSPDLEQANAQLTEGLDLEAFLTGQERSGSMMGSDSVTWPDEHEKVLGLTLLLIFRFAENAHEMADFGHTYFYAGSSIMKNVHAVTRQVIVPFNRDYKTYVLSQGQTMAKIVRPLTNRVFVVHGHDGEAREAVARFLEKIGFDPVILHEQANRSRTIIEKIEANHDVSFAVILLTPDDEGCVKGGTPEPRARQNVLLELGYFMAHLGRENVCALKRGQVEIPSDFAGVVWEPMDDNGGWRASLARELEAAGHSIDWNQVMKPR
ncbi:nucleotide-binding protein (plasmid) [Rhizobium sp. CB3171]|uniref:nucleotide-binding protein n=1 Tax=Rhizobium sp. CB3171 TaxID=3039157 RepID=UPI0024B06A3E|nr:nucleotide-binding protein [Rhizobium sp. CB3171]WFU07526.1 nucleotide-binding protein [Rhizobium sp. CB3171]